LVIKLKSASTAQYGTTLMPLNRSSLTDEAIAAIEAWIARGAPND
jgi:cytochrome c553